jgi:predicted dehydrogenase
VTLPSPTPNTGAVAHHPFQEEIDNLVEKILGGTPVLSDILDACNSTEIVLAIEESARTGKPANVKGI